jgi:hypothetical protein
MEELRDALTPAVQRKVFTDNPCRFYDLPA